MTRGPALLLPLVLLTACARKGHDDQKTAAPLPPPSLAGTATSNVADLCKGSTVRSWAILVEDQPVAVTRGRCLGKEESEWHLVTQLALMSEDTPRYELHLWLDDDGTPKRAEYRTATAVKRFAWADGSMRIEQHGDARMIQAGSHLWVFPSHAVYLRETMLRLGIGRTESGATHTGYLPEVDALSRLELRIEGEKNPPRVMTDGASFVLAATKDLAGLRIESAEASGTPLYRAIDGEPFEPSLPAEPRPSYTLPEGLRTVAVAVPKEPELAGELVLREAETTSRAPGVLFVSPSGPQERHGFVPDSSIDVGTHEIADALASAGIVVLRVDDRGIGESRPGPADAGFKDEVADVRRALEVLAARHEVDPTKLVVIGHGEGAVRAILAAQNKIKVGAKSHRVAGVVLLAAPGRKLDELALDEIRNSLAGRPTEELMAALDLAADTHERVKTKKPLPPEHEPRRKWMEEAFAIEPVAELRKVTRAKIPVFALQGGKDFQVDPKRDFERIAEALVGAPFGSGAASFPALDHLFKPEPATSTAGHYGDLSRKVDPEVVSKIVEWVRSTTTKK